jgi:hypothetical protein
MNWNQISPFLSIILNLISVIIYACSKDFPHAFYWLLAAGFTFTVTFLFKGGV